MKPRKRDKTKEGQSMILSSGVLLYTKSSISVGTYIFRKQKCTKFSLLNSNRFYWDFEYIGCISSKIVIQNSILSR